MAGKNFVPTNWKGYLHDENNKEEHFAFLSTKIAAVNYLDSKEVFATLGQRVLSNTSEMLLCDHEEADTWIVVHITDEKRTEYLCSV